MCTGLCVHNTSGVDTHYYTYLSAAYVDMFGQAGHLCCVYWSAMCTVPVVWLVCYVYSTSGVGVW